MNRLTRCVVVALCGAFFIAPVQAQQACGPRDAIVKRLSDVYQETRNAAGLAANGNLVEVFAAVSGSWSLLMTRPGGLTCVIAVGQHWQHDKPTKPRGEDI